MIIEKLSTSVLYFDTQSILSREDRSLQMPFTYEIICLCKWRHSFFQRNEFENSFCYILGRDNYL